MNPLKVFENNTESCLNFKCMETTPNKGINIGTNWGGDIFSATAKNVITYSNLKSCTTPAKRKLTTITTTLTQLKSRAKLKSRQSIKING